MTLKFYTHVTHLDFPPNAVNTKQAQTRNIKAMAEMDKILTEKMKEEDGEFISMTQSQIEHRVITTIVYETSEWRLVEPPE